jgi:putative transcriptional regulator
MLHDNIKRLRQQKGMTQEILAEKLHIVRQTVSKWEKGLSVPDSEMLVRLAEVFEVSVSELLGETSDFVPEKDSVAEQLALINEQLIIKNRRARRIWKVILVIFIAINLFIGGLLLLFMVDPESGTEEISESVEYIEE